MVKLHPFYILRLNHAEVHIEAGVQDSFLSSRVYSHYQIKVHSQLHFFPECFLYHFTMSPRVIFMLWHNILRGTDV